MKLPHTKLTKELNRHGYYNTKQAVSATWNNNQRERSQIAQIDKGYFICLPSVPHFQSVAYAVEQSYTTGRKNLCCRTRTSPTQSIRTHICSI